MCRKNKGIALFPRRIDGRYVMFSDNHHFWSDPQILMRPAEVWESVKVGNGGSPIETGAGWLRAGMLCSQRGL